MIPQDIWIFFSHEWKTPDSYHPWCIPLPWRRWEARDTHGESAWCGSCRRILLWRELWSSWARIHWEDDRTWRSSICQVSEAYDPQMAILLAGSYPLGVWYRDILRGLSRCAQTCESKCKEDILLPYATTLSLWLPREVPQWTPSNRPTDILARLHILRGSLWTSYLSFWYDIHQLA